MNKTTGILICFTFWAFVGTWFWMSDVAVNHYEQIAANQFNMGEW